MAFPSILRFVYLNFSIIELQGIHVTLLIIDGSIDAERTGEDKWIKAENLADTLYFITKQDKSAWTFTMDVRPFVEKW